MVTVYHVQYVKVSGAQNKTNIITSDSYYTLAYK